MPTINGMSVNREPDTKSGGPDETPGATKEDNAIYRYPINVGSDNVGHYILIHINKQKKTQYPSPFESTALPQIMQNQADTGMTRTNMSFDQSRVGPNQGQGAGRQFASGFTGSVGNSPAQFQRPIVRTGESIALYMPDTLQFAWNQKYDVLATTGLPAALLSAGKSLADAQKMPGDRQQNIISNLGVFAGAGLLKAMEKGGFGEGFTRAAGQSILGVVQNPMLEVIYSSPDLRSFRFDFMFYPRDNSEAAMIQLISQKLRFEQAPEVLKSSAGFFLVPPSEFDIKFMYNGQINPNIPPVSTCVLETVDIDYAPNGWAAYELSGENSRIPILGGTGMPVAMRMSLQFREVEIITKEIIMAMEKY